MVHRRRPHRQHPHRGREPDAHPGPPRGPHRNRPVITAYSIPLRDCSQCSSRSAQSDADYRVWISVLAHGIGKEKAVIVLEPDVLANLPSDCSPDTDPTGTLTASAKY